MCLAIPGEIISIQEGEPLQRRGKARFGGIVKEVSLALTPEAAIGQYVLVHAGIAIGTVNPEEAAKVFEYLRQMGEAEELREAPP